MLSITIVSLVSCEEQEIKTEYSYLRVRSYEIMAYAYEDANGDVDHLTIVPHKIYVSGGAPDNTKGYYIFKLSEGSTLPDYLKLDTVCGILYGDTESTDGALVPHDFEITVYDGIKTAVSKYSIKFKNVKSGTSAAILPLHFTSPETNLIGNNSNQQFGVSISIEGGAPPYLFSVVPGDQLPGDLKLDGRRGIIYGNISKLKPGNYPFRIICFDSKGTRASSLITTTEYEVFNLIIR